MRPTFIFTLLTLLFICGCKKNTSEEDQAIITCNNIQNTTLTSNSPVTIGQTMYFGTQEVGGYRVYSWQGPNNYTSQEPSDSITNAQLQSEGWYYLDLYSADGSCQKIDSFYFDVKLQQGVPTCNIDNNTTTYNNLIEDNYASVVKSIDPTFSQKALICSGGIYSNMTIYFHTHWRSTEPEDGIYLTINTPTFDQTDNNYNKVFITTTKSSIYWSSDQSQTVYISHIGQKLQVRFCDLTLRGNNGANYTTIASGNIVEQ